MQGRYLSVAVCGWLLLSMTVAFCADDPVCASAPAQAQLRRLAIKRLEVDQMLNDMADLDRADLSLSQVETIRKADGSTSCKAVLTLRVMYGAGLRRTIENSVSYDLQRHGDDQHLAVKIHRLATAF